MDATIGFTFAIDETGFSWQEALFLVTLFLAVAAWCIFLVTRKPPPRNDSKRS